MKGIELCEKFYNEYGKPLIDDKFSNFKQFFAVGVSGGGSECYGFDDEISLDHDFEVGFQIYLPKEIESEIGFKLQREYNAIVKDCPFKIESKSSFGKAEKFGVRTIEEHFEELLGFSNLSASEEVWLNTPSFALSQATNGKIFDDYLGKFSKLKNNFKKGFPQDVLKKKISAHLLLAFQAGEYNYFRMAKRGDYLACSLSLNEFIKHIIFVIYSLNESYMPYYKWQMRMMENFSHCKTSFTCLKKLLLSENCNTEEKCLLIKTICSDVICCLKEKNYIDKEEKTLEDCAFSIFKSINSRSLKMLHIMDYGEF